MSVSINRIAAALAAGLLVSTGALAQGAPVSLLPAQTPAVAPDAAAPPAAPVPDDAMPAEESSAPSISSSALDAPSTDRIGLIDAAGGGFSADMWRGTDLELLRRLLPQLPRRMDSLAQRRLARSLLLSAATPPAAVAPAAQPVVGADGALATPSPPPAQWLLETRLIGLAAIGSWDDALALMDLVPADQMTDGLRKLRADGALITGRTNAACGEAQAALNATGDPYWQKLQIYCNFANNQASAASLGLSVLREQGIQDPLFFWAVDLLSGNRRLSPPNLGRPEPVHLVMLAKAGGPVPDSLIQGGDPTTLAVVAGISPIEDKADKTPAAQRAERRKQAEETRVTVAERAVGAGTLDAERLRLLYRQLNVKDEPPPALATITVATVRERVHLFQTALAQAVPAARAEVIGRAIDLTRADRGRHGPDLITVGRIYTPLILEISPSPELVWFSGAATRALIAAGELEKGREWLELARSMARTSIEAGQIADGLWPLDRLLTPGPPQRLPPQALQAWRETFSQEKRAEYQGMLLNMLMAVGEPITASDWLSDMGEAAPAISMRVTSARIVNGIDLAQRDKRVGETAVFALLALGEEGPSAVEPAAIQKVIAALAAVGRERDARALAVEALLVEGL